MKKNLTISICGMALAISTARAQPADDYKFVPSAQQKLVPDKTGFYAQTMLSREKNSFALITSRDKTGESESHAGWGDYIFVQEGGATMVLGGTLENPHDVGPGETRGSGISGGKNFDLHPGDYVFVPVNTAHRMILAPGQTIRYAVVKARP